MKKKDESSIGLIYGLFTFCMWGFLPVYFKALDHINPFEILVNRIMWSVIFLIALLYKTKRFANLKLIIQDRKRVILMFFTGLLITSNWGTYIFAITKGMILEASLGYFINPLMSMLLGAIFLKEKLDKASKISILLVIVAVLVQIFSLGKLPVISLLLPLTFSFYGLLKKFVKAPSLEGLFMETVLMFPIALGFFIYFLATNQSGFNSAATASLLMFSGLITVIPLVSFNIAATRLKLTTLGFLQYISPTIGIILAVCAYGEKLDMSKIVSFVFIWIALIIVTIDGYSKMKRKRAS